MHDIICPNCGERFLGYDVAFDMSEYILPLLYSDMAMEDDVRAVQFKYFVDEEVIRRSNTDSPESVLVCENPGGPKFSEPSFPFNVSCAILLDYIISKSGYNEEDMLQILEEMKPFVDRNAFHQVTPLQLNQISTLYHLLFGASKQLVGDISIDDAHVRTALKILIHIYDAAQTEDLSNSMVLDVCIYSSNMNGIPNYHVPDILFVKKNGYYERLKKCCRFCGKELPSEFGYYRMKPVVLLGSHASGKTSYLLSLLHAVQSKQPFIDNPRLTTTTLSNDFNLTAFMKNIERFRRGEEPLKTDFQDVPILNLKVHDTIYSFIDWPGEKFISGSNADQDYIYIARRVITHAHHVFFFLPPEQVDETMPAPDENVCFNIMDLQGSLAWHLSFPDKRRMKSLVYVLNKADKLENRNNTSGMFASIEGRSEADLYAGAWQQKAYDTIERETKSYIMQQHPSLYNVLNGLQISGIKNYIPVAPYGQDLTTTEGQQHDRVVIHRGFFAGVPFMRILKTDGIV